MPDRTRPTPRRPSPAGGRRRHRGGTTPTLPTGPVAVDTGTAEVQVDPADPSRALLLVNGVPSSHLDLEDPTWLEFEYMQHMAAAVDLLPGGPVDAVHLGAAACALPRWVEATRPGSRQLAVDVDARLLTLVRSWFELPRSPRLRLRAGDARAVLTGLADSSVDLVVRDVFAGDTTPEHLTTVEFVEEVARVLRPGGLYLANCADRPPLALARAEVVSTSAVLPTVLIAEPAQLKGRRYGNLVLAAARPGGPDLAGPAFGRALRTLAVPAHALAREELRRFAGRALPRHDAPPEVAPPAG